MTTGSVFNGLRMAISLRPRAGLSPTALRRRLTAARIAALKATAARTAPSS